MTLSFLAFIMLNCKNKEEETVTKSLGLKENTKTEKTAMLEEGCYTYEGNGSSIRFEVTQTENQVLGNLTYALSEKDKNTGTFKGKMNGNKLLGSYTFQSEGKKSTRQVAFQLKSNQLLEGYGDRNTDGTRFKDPNTLTYTDAMPLTHSACD